MVLFCIDLFTYTFIKLFMRCVCGGRGGGERIVEWMEGELVMDFRKFQKFKVELKNCSLNMLKIVPCLISCKIFCLDLKV